MSTASAAGSGGSGGPHRWGKSCSRCRTRNVKCDKVDDDEDCLNCKRRKETCEMPAPKASSKCQKCTKEKQRCEYPPGGDRCKRCFRLGCPCVPTRPEDPPLPPSSSHPPSHPPPTAGRNQDKTHYPYDPFRDEDPPAQHSLGVSRRCFPAARRMGETAKVFV